MAGTNLSRANGSGSATTKFTYSVWLKYSGWYTGGQRFFSATGGSGDTYFRFNEDGTLEVSGDNSAATSLGYFITNRKFRDHSAWMHIVIKVDTTQSTQTDRFKLYINGVDEAGVGGYSTGTYPNQNADDNISLSSNTHYIGGAASSQYFNGLMTHIHYSDNYAYDASTFGETDSTSGIWKPKTNPSLTYGTNGYFLKMENSGAMGTDSSGNTNTFSVANGTLTQNVDTPSNNFSTYNPLDNYYASSTFSNGNTTIVTNSGNTTYNTSTLGIPPTMKCYWETKFDTVQAANGEVGIVNTPTTGSAAGSYRLYYQTYGISVNDGGAIWSANADTGITLGTLSTSDIVCFAWDGVNQALYVRKNGDAWINSGDPTSGASKTGAVKSFSGTSLTMFPAVGDQSGSHAVGTSTNFGSGYFGTTAVASAGTAPSEGGIFEYNCPSGYQALCTKGINSF